MFRGADMTKPAELERLVDVAKGRLLRHKFSSICPSSASFVV
jgi:hypothetical protein